MPPKQTKQLLSLSTQFRAQALILLICIDRQGWVTSRDEHHVPLSSRPDFVCCLEGKRSLASPAHSHPSPALLAACFCKLAQRPAFLPPSGPRSRLCCLFCTSGCKAPFGGWFPWCRPQILCLLLRAQLYPVLTRDPVRTQRIGETDLFFQCLLWFSFFLGSLASDGDCS